MLIAYGGYIVRYSYMIITLYIFNLMFKDAYGGYIVLYSYSAQDENDLSVERGQCVTVLNKVNYIMMISLWALVDVLPRIFRLLLCIILYFLYGKMNR